jgi:hypothetical protein
MDKNSLSAMFPGLVIGLNNGSGNQWYYVNAVYAHVSLDGCVTPYGSCAGGTHPGYVQVFAVPGNISRQYGGAMLPVGGGSLAGTAGPTPTTYTTTGSPHGEVVQINQQSYSWSCIKLNGSTTC